MIIAAVLAAFLVFDLPGARAEETPALTAGQAEAVRKLVRDHILENPEIIAEAIEALREKQRLAAEAEAARTLIERRKDIFEDPDDPVAGNPQGDVTVVEFFDYRCTYCKKVSDMLFETVKGDGKVRLVLKEFPILGEESVIAARAALAARTQGKYEQFHLAMMELRGSLSGAAAMEEAIIKVAGKVGLDIEKLRADMGDAAIGDILRANHELARALDISGTPAFIIGDRIIPGALDRQTLTHLIALARKGPEKP